MGQIIFGIDIQAEVGRAIPSGSLPAFTLRKPGTGIRDPLSLTSGTQPGPPNDYECHGTITNFTVDEMQENTLIQRGDKKIVIIAAPLGDTKIDTNDLLIDETGASYTVVSADTTSAEASWICVCRG